MGGNTTALEGRLTAHGLDPGAIVPLGAHHYPYRLLPLERNSVTFFPLSWTIVHPIDESSPLAGKSREELVRDQAEILVLLTGVDETYEQTVHARTSYRADEIVWNARFKSVFRGVPSSELLSIDVSRLHEIERV